MTGSDKERELATLLDMADYHVMRSPSSGGGTKRDLPDLHWGKGGESWAAEMKYTGTDTAYYTEDEVAALERFCEAFDATAFLVARFKQDTTFYYRRPQDARRTDKDNYAIDRDGDKEVLIE